MHMADALVSPAVGGALWTASAVLIATSSRKIANELDDKKVPLMGVVAAFIFAAQMINFTIPATGSSGHLGGGLILAILLGPYAAFLTMASVLTVQALFFADGGLLALGANIFNLGFFPCFIAYPLIYKPLAADQTSKGRIAFAAILAAVIGLQMGSLGVVIETVSSGITELSFSSFLLLMQPIHLAIGIVEGLATAAVVMFVQQARPELLQAASTNTSIANLSLKKVFVGLGVATLITGVMLSWFASTHPDGLEWSIFKTTGEEELAPPAAQDRLYKSLAQVQETTAVLPDYGFKASEAAEEEEASWPAVSAGTSVSGLVGSALTLFLAAFIGLLLKRRSRATR